MDTAAAVVAVALTTLMQERICESPLGVHPVFPVAHNVLAPQTTSRKRSSFVCSVALVPDCGAAGGTLLPCVSVPLAAHCGWLTFSWSGVPVMANTAKALAAGPLQFASLAT